MTCILRPKGGWNVHSKLISSHQSPSSDVAYAVIVSSAVHQRGCTCESWCGKLHDMLLKEELRII